MNLNQKYNSLRQNLKALDNVVIGYSGGVDSTLLVKVAVDELGAENVLACIAGGVLLPHSQYSEALEIASQIGVKIKIIELGELNDTKFTANNADRCFHCKSHLCKMLLSIAENNKFNCVALGENFDDKKDCRPGSRAAQKFNVRFPLAEAEMTKDDIRTLSRQLNLPTADKPSQPCLASRIAYGIEITKEKLKQVEVAEEFLTQLGFSQLRVRHHGAIARIEVCGDDIQKVTAEPLRIKIAEKLKSIGFKYVTVDTEGFRSGSLNEVLSKEKKKDKS